MKKKKKLFLVIFILFLFLVGWLFSKLDIWTINSFEVTNNLFVTKERLLQTASTLNYGDNLLYYPSAKISKELTNAIPQLHKVMIKKNPFKKTVTFKLKEKEPFVNIIYYPNCYVVSEEGILLNVDASGNVFDLENILDLPILTGIDENLLINQTSLPAEYTGLLKNLLKKFFNFFGKETLKLDVTSKKDIVVMTDDIFDIKIGDTDRLDDKIKVFKTLFKNIKDRKDDIMYIDIRYPDYPVVRYVR
ncbi:MAG: cell division protein FtsQ/DivIB [Candidatus Margulisbacteria bacterium]|nr:cell division protein FtsQ/DivIB [Candidatus Margulisiibacteriota bacterium]